MLHRIRLIAGAITLAGAALLTSPDPAHSTMRLPLDNPFEGTRFCCGYDADGDRKPEAYCCHSTGCSAGPGGCVRVG